MTEEELMREDEDFSKAMLLLDSLTALEEEFAKATLLLDPSLSLEDEFNESALLLDSTLSLGVTGEERPSSSQAARRSKLEIAKAIILFDFFNAT
jgi:hypothetical protein